MSSGWLWQCVWGFWFSLLSWEPSQLFAKLKKIHKVKSSLDQETLGSPGWQGWGTLPLEYERARKEEARFPA